MIFYTAVDLKLIMIFWHIMMQVKMCLKKKLLTIQTWARRKSMKLRLLSIRMLMIWKSYDSEKLVDYFLLNVRIELEDLIMIFSYNADFLWKIYNHPLLKTNSQKRIQNIGLQGSSKLNYLMIIYFNLRGKSTKKSFSILM